MYINMIGIITSQFPEMKHFYHKIMGMPLKTEMDAYVEFEHPGVRFAISSSKVMQEATGHPSYAQEKQGQALELAFALDNPEQVDSAYADLTKRGASPVKAPADMPWGQRAAFFADPDGNIHEIFAELAD